MIKTGANLPQRLATAADDSPGTSVVLNCRTQKNFFLCVLANLRVLVERHRDFRQRGDSGGKPATNKPPETKRERSFLTPINAYVIFAFNSYDYKQMVELKMHTAATCSVAAALVSFAVRPHFRLT